LYSRVELRLWDYKPQVVEGDTMRIQLSALVRNYTDVPYVFDITLKINSPPSGGVVTVTPSSG